MVIASSVNDLLIRIKNAGLARKRKVRVPYSSFAEAIARLLQKEKYLAKVEKKGSELILELAYRGKKPVIRNVRNVSKPGVRIYQKAKKIRPPLGGVGITIVSTPQGIMTHVEAKKKGVGGEVIAQVF